MGNVKLNFAAVFSTMVLIIFAGVSFLGMVYWQSGEIFIPLLLALVFTGAVLLCIYLMRKAKATRWTKIGTISQILLGFVIFVLFLIGSIPFTNFLRVWNDRHVISQSIDDSYQAAEALDNAYAEYVDNRINDYESNLQLISQSKNIKPSEYQKCLGGATGTTEADKIKGLSKSLRQKLMPDSTVNIVQKRHEWLQGTKDFNPLNPFTAANINKIDEQVNGWIDNYKGLSSVSYSGENANNFEYEDFKSNVTELTESYTKLQKPSFGVMIITIICFLIMLLPYFLTETDIAGNKRQNRKTKNETGNLFIKQESDEEDEV